MTRAGLSRRLAALEAKRMIATMPFVLEDGRTIHVDILDVLAVFTEGARWACAAQDGEELSEPPSPTFELLGCAVSTPDSSVLAGSLVRMARAARAQREAIPGQVVDE